MSVAMQIKQLPWRKIYLVFMFSVLILWWVGLSKEREKRARQNIQNKAPSTVLPQQP